MREGVGSCEAWMQCTQRCENHEVYTWTYHEGEDAEVDDDGEQKHADGAGYALQQGSLQCIIKKQLS